MSIRNYAIALGLAGALALGATSSASAGPFPIGSASVKNATTGQFTDVRWRGRGIGPGLAFGLAAGALAGAAAAARPYYYGPDYYYGAPAYAEPYGYAPGPAYVAPSYDYGWGQCTTNEGYGRRRPCDAN